MIYKFDLHIHSAASFDGRMELEEIVDRARAVGLSGVAITDHDLLCREAWNRFENFLLIPGQEFSTECGHLLGLFLRQEIPFTRQPGRAPEAPGGVAELIEAIHRQGGLAVLAHPFERGPDEAAVLALAPHLDGLEVWNGRANRKFPGANARAAEFAGDLGLAPFGGSDAHVGREIGNGVVTLEAEALTPEAVKTALKAGGARVSGKNGRHLDVARSQRTKLKRQKAGLGPRLKWLAFALKCGLEDLIHGP